MKEWVQLIATTVFGLIAVYIAYQQWRTNDLKVRHDLYDKRLCVWLAVMDFLSCIIRNAKASDEELFAFLQKKRESYFLFGKEMDEYLDDLYKKGVALRSQEKKMGILPVSEQRSKVVDENMELLTWFGDQFNVAREKFSKHMKLW